jgi:pimeloyl-ACP methyl ester carboxylesterase
MDLSAECSYQAARETGPPVWAGKGCWLLLRGVLAGLLFTGSFIELLAERFTVIRYDKPGCGLSDREPVDLSFESPGG